MSDKGIKIVKLPYGKNVHRYINHLSVLVLFVGMALFFKYLGKNWTKSIIGGVLLFGSAYYLRALYFFKVIFITNDINFKEEITDINNLGFVVVEDDKNTPILWDSIEFIELLSDNSLEIKQFSAKPVQLTEKYSNWFTLLQQIPKSKLNSDKIPTYLENVFSRLESCPICGFIALDIDRCFNCYSDRYGKEQRDMYENKIEFIKEEQLFLFGTYEKDEPIEFYPKPIDGFKFNKDWKPLVTKKEVLEYSKINNWDEDN